LRRIKRRAVPELQEAFANAELSLRKFDILSRLSPRQQRRIVATERAGGAAALLAARAIDELLNVANPGQVRLSEVTAAIRNAVQFGAVYASSSSSNALYCRNRVVAVV
jgi:hypothetical protein